MPRLPKPVLRGVFHELGFYAAAAIGIVLVATAEPGRARAAGAIFAAGVAVCFGASALYHRPTWRPRPRAWLARLDHAGVYLLIAGTYAPFGLIVMSKGWAVPVLAIVYARRRPNPYPRVFGYHEIFHVLTVAAAACQYVAVAFYVLPRA